MRMRGKYIRNTPKPWDSGTLLLLLMISIPSKMIPDSVDACAGCSDPCVVLMSLSQPSGAGARDEDHSGSYHEGCT